MALGAGVRKDFRPLLPRSRYRMPDAVAAPTTQDAEVRKARKRRTADELKASLNDKIRVIEEREKQASRKMLELSKLQAELFVKKYPTGKAGTHANQAAALLGQAIAAM
jgi:hypothetical protein